MMSKFTEDTVEQAALIWLEDLDYTIKHGPDIAPDEPAAERDSYDDVLLFERMVAGLARINIHIPRAALDGVLQEVIRKVQRIPSQNLVQANHEFHRLLVEGVDVSFRHEGYTHYDKVWLVDFDHPEANEWLAVNQYTVTDVNLTTRSKTNRRPDIVLFVNGIPLVVIELKNPADASATMTTAFNQFMTYKDDIPSLFVFNEGLVLSDGVEAWLGTLTAGREWFKRWRTEDGETLAPPGKSELEVMIKGVFAPARFLDMVRYFTVFDVDGPRITKKMAAYHQYHAVNKAVEQTLRVAHRDGDHKVGVVWHTQGSGKSLSMLFYAGKVIQHPEMENPTLVILTDRNDLDDQLFGTFASGQELLRQEPAQAETRENLRELLQVASGGVVFTTIQKFSPEGRENEYPLLSERHNIIFIADEAHRSQYGFEARLTQSRSTGEAYISYGFAKYVRDALPNASFIGFTGTPIETTDANTPQVFGDYIDIYDIQRAVDDGATVPIYYEARLAKLKLKDEMRPQIDRDFEEVIEGEELEGKEKLKSRWSRLEAMVGTEERLQQVAQDIVEHFETRTETLDGKAMIVCMSRRIAVEMYQQIVNLRPEWHGDTDDTGAIKVIMTGSAGDPPHYQPHIRNKPRRKALAERFKTPDDPFRVVIVRDMWLTGFDAPSLHTMYVDKPMRGHGLMQAIARVNRVFKDKPGGLVVDYLGIATDLQEAVDHYTVSGAGRPALPQEEAVALMHTQFERAQALFHGFDYSKFHDGSPTERLSVIPQAMEHILQQDDGKKRFMDIVLALSKAFALAIPHEEALAIRDDVAFFQAVRSAFAKATPAEGKTLEEMDSAIKQLVSEAVTSNEVINILDAAGLQRPDISILSDEFLAHLKGLPQRNLALEVLRKLLLDEIKAKSRKNAVQARSFADMLDETVLRYQNRSIDVAQIITELIDMAKDMREADRRGEEPGLNDDELAFYDALADNESAVDIMGNEELAFIARQLVKQVRNSVSIDWSVKQGARAKIRVAVKRILRKYGYPPDLQEKATETVLEQAELLATEWVGSV